MKNDNACERFKDQVLLVTGGTSGIGLATAVQFAKAGAAHVIVWGRTPAKWEQAQDYLQQYLTKEQAQKIEYWPCDVRIESQVKDGIEKIYSKYGRLDVAFNNAGVSPGIQPGGTDLENMNFGSMLGEDGAVMFSLASPQPTSKNVKDPSWKASDPTEASLNSDYRENPIATSVFGVFYSMKWEIHYAFKKQPKDLPFAIINTSSRNGIVPDPNRPLYAASKAFIIALTKSLSNSVAQRSVKENRAMVRINAIAPGPVDTPLERSAFPTNFDAFAGQGVPMQRVAQPEEIAPAVLFLADHNQSSYITGAILPVDGGDVASPYIPPI
jgi:NAD(P)-dependent dehydrogenase (short-subunit alcohol dehydrogenase family)